MSGTQRRPEEVAIVVRRPGSGRAAGGANVEDSSADEYLVLLRSPEQEGYWHLVAGGAEWDEPLAVAAARELVEEVGLQAEVHDLGLALSYSLAEESERVRSRFAPGTERVAVSMYLAVAPAGWEPTLDREHVEYRWLPAAEAIELLFWPEPKDAVRAAAAVVA